MPYYVIKKDSSVTCRSPYTEILRQYTHQATSYRSECVLVQTCSSEDITINRTHSSNPIIIFPGFYCNPVGCNQATRDGYSLDTRLVL